VKQFDSQKRGPMALVDPCRLVRQVKQFDSQKRGPMALVDPCRLVRQVKEFDSYPGTPSSSSLPSIILCVFPKQPRLQSMIPEPLYCPKDLSPAFQLRYGWTAWPSKTAFPTNILALVLPDIAPEWERDGIRVLESDLAPEQIQLTLSTTPQVDPVTLAARIKGRCNITVEKEAHASNSAASWPYGPLEIPPGLRWKTTSTTR
jgi:hypothetical protein